MGVILAQVAQVQQHVLQAVQLLMLVVAVVHLTLVVIQVLVEPVAVELVGVDIHLLLQLQELII
tara:strand:- start:126 stop:317 length:192 start_codon:yes stop_codon:yes gene_type:complete